MWWKSYLKEDNNPEFSIFIICIAPGWGICYKECIRYDPTEIHERQDDIPGACKQTKLGYQVPLIFAFWVIFHASMSSADFFKIHFFKKFFQEYRQCQTVWIQIRPNISSGLIWVKTVCKGYQQTTLVCKELNIQMDQQMKFWNLSNMHKELKKACIYVSSGAWGHNFGLSLHLHLVLVNINAHAKFDQIWFCWNSIDSFLRYWMQTNSEIKGHNSIINNRWILS